MSRATSKKTTPARKKRTQAVAKSYQRTPQEQAAVDAMYARKEAKHPAPWVKVSNEAPESFVSLDHKDPKTGGCLLMGAVGTTSCSFLNGLLNQLSHVAAKGQQVSEGDLNFMLSVIRDIEPADQLEAMLAAQMAAVHMATMKFACRLNQVDTIDQQDSAERAFNKLARTFTTQVEALKRYRTGGEQRMVVEHVTVNEGGQAIVGSVSHGGVGVQKKTRATP
jgi:hypothetical protein